MTIRCLPRWPVLLLLGALALYTAPIPGAEPAAFFRELAREKNASSVFCFGHAPHVDGLLAAAVGAPRHITSMKKAGVALVELKRVSPPNGQLIWLVTPKLFRKAK